MVRKNKTIEEKYKKHSQLEHLSAFSYSFARPAPQRVIYRALYQAIAKFASDENCQQK